MSRSARFVRKAPFATKQVGNARDGSIAPVAYMPKPWQPLNVLMAAEEAVASRV